MIRPFHPALWIALSTASILSHPCSGITSGRYVAVNDCFDVSRVRLPEDENGEDVSEEDDWDVKDGCGNVM